MVSIKCLNDDSDINLLENYEYPVSAYLIINSINTKIKEKYNIDILNDLEIYKELDEKQNELLGKDTEIYGNEKLLIKINEISYNKLVSCCEKELEKEQEEIHLLENKLREVTECTKLSYIEISDRIKDLKKKDTSLRDECKSLYEIERKIFDKISILENDSINLKNKISKSENVSEKNSLEEKLIECNEELSNLSYKLSEGEKEFKKRQEILTQYEQSIIILNNELDFRKRKSPIKQRTSFGKGRGGRGRVSSRGGRGRVSSRGGRGRALFKSSMGGRAKSKSRAKNRPFLWGTSRVSSKTRTRTSRQNHHVSELTYLINKKKGSLNCKRKTCRNDNMGGRVSPLSLAFV